MQCINYCSSTQLMMNGYNIRVISDKVLIMSEFPAGLHVHARFYFLLLNCMYYGQAVLYC